MPYLYQFVESKTTAPLATVLKDEPLILRIGSKLWLPEQDPDQRSFFIVDDIVLALDTVQGARDQHFHVFASKLLPN